MQHYWVVGGRYRDTSFSQLAEGEEELRQGPFDSYDAALKAWQSRAWQTVDDALAHYHIEQQEITDRPTEPAWWVVGGRFSDSSFSTWASPPERFGPFPTREQAHRKWQEMAWKTVDDATARYRIEKLDPLADIDPKPSPLPYRLLTGRDDRAFCERVSAALAEGYQLYGSPSITVSADGSQRFVAQAIVRSLTPADSR